MLVGVLYILVVFLLVLVGKKIKISNEGLVCSDVVFLNVIWWNIDEFEWEEEVVLVNLVRRLELICVYRVLDIYFFRLEVGAISS